jgi:lambda family phage portal protein
MSKRPKSAKRRVLAVEGSGLEAGRYSRRMSGWVPARDHVNTLITSSGRTALARARYLVRNNPYAAAAVECFASNLAGSGIMPSWSIEGDATRKTALQNAWKTWTDESDAEGLTDLYGQMRRGARELFIAGEFFVRRRPRYLSDGLSVPVQIQMLPSEQLPVELSMELAGGNYVRQGIEFDKIGRRVAYHFWRVNPGDLTERPQQGQTTIVPASEVLHVFDPVEAGQIRGLSRLTPAIVSLFSLDAYDDAEMERKKVAALFTAFVKRADPDGEMFDKEKEEAAKTDNGIAQVTLEPGRLHVLFPGEDIATAAPADVGPNYEAFQYRALTRIAAALGLPYAGMTGDMVRANYANQRAALVQLRRAMEALQHSVMVFLFCRPVANWFLDAAVLAKTVELPGYAADPAPYRNITWIPPRWEWVDPLKDRQAEVLAVNAGFKARSRVIEAEGLDPIEEDQRIAEDQRRAKELGLVFVGTTTPAKEIAAPPEDGATAAEDNTAPQDRAAPAINGHAPGPIRH